MKNFYLLYSSDGAILNKEINDLEKKLDISDTDIYEKVFPGVIR